MLNNERPHLLESKQFQIDQINCRLKINIEKLISLKLKLDGI